MKCSCGNETTNRGGSFGGLVSSSNEFCGVCNRRSLAVSLYGQHLLICYSGPNIARGAPSPIETWINTCLLPQVKTIAAIKKAEDVREWETWLKEQFYPQFPDCADYPNGKLYFFDLPSAAKKAITAMFGENEEKHGYYLHDYSVPPFYPAQIPPGIEAMFLDRHREWGLVDTGISRTIPVPEDPERLSNLRFFAETFLSRNMCFRVISNEYSSDSPYDWFEVRINTGIVKIGWRHRVISIIAADDRFKELFSRLGEQDNTTYSGVTLHAWGEKKLIEYLDAMRAQ